MKLKTITLSALCAASISIQAQVTEVVSAEAKAPQWKRSSSYGANFSNAGFNNNWQAGGQNSMGFNIFGNYKMEKTKGKNTWTHEAQGQIGLIGLENNSGDFEFKKSIDRIFLDSKYARKISDKWSLFANINFLSQFYATKNYNKEASSNLLTSNFFAPAFFTESIGLEWKPVSYFTMSFSPGAFRQTIVADNNVRKIVGGVTEAKTFGVEKGKTIYNEVALLQVVSNFDKDIAKNVNLKLRHTFFANYKNLAHMDNRLDAKFTAKVNEYISANLDINMLYDDDQIARLQTAYNFGIGLLIKK